MKSWGTCYRAWRCRLALFSIIFQSWKRTYPTTLFFVLLNEVLQRQFKPPGCGGCVYRHLCCTTSRFQRQDSFCNTPLRPYLTFSILDLLTCRELLGVRLGSHFLHTASTNKDNYVSAQVRKNYNPWATRWLTANLHRRLFEHCPHPLFQPRICTRTLRASRAHIMFNGLRNIGRVMCESPHQDVTTFLTLYQPRRPFRDPRQIE